MKSTIGIVLGAILCVSAAAGAAHAADPAQWAGTATAVLSGLGQGIGEAATGGPSILVTATGHAKLAGATALSFSIDFEGKSETADGATRARDHAVDQALAAARQFGVESTITSEDISRVRETGLRNLAASAVMPGVQPPPLFIKPVEGSPAGASPVARSPAPKLFVDSVTIRFHPSDPKRLPAFLDALVAAGIDYDLQGKLSQQGFSPFAGLGGGEQKVDDATWDRASVDAMNVARRQADVLASAAGRRVGDARQVLMIAKTVQAEDATVTVAVRYGLVPPS